jgi:hypothetical protein
MRAFFLTGSIIFTVLILIIAFENLGAGLQNFLFLFAGVDSAFFMVIGLSMLGIFTGIFYTGLVTALLRGGKEDEESPGAEW